MLEHLNEVNDVPVYSVYDERFRTYGRVLSGYDTEGVVSYLKHDTMIPSSGNVYVASDPGLEALPFKPEIEQVFYGGMPVQIGYCNGRNTTYNGFEYHKGSEINITASGCMLFLSHTWLIRDNTIRTEDGEVFFVPAGVMFEMFETTLHLSPCRVCDEGFRVCVILPQGTNTPLSAEEKMMRDGSSDPEAKLLLQRNKWVLSHPERSPLMDQGAWPGFLGENKELKY